MANIHSELKKTKDGLFNFCIKSSNGEIIFSSESYTSKHTAITCLETLLAAIIKDEYEEGYEFDSFRKPYISVKTDYNVVVNSTTYDSYAEAKLAFLNFKNSLIGKDTSTIDKINKGKAIQKDNRVSSVVDFVGRVSRLERKPGTIYYFRGHSDYSYELVPGIYRKEKRWINHEHKLFREIMLKCPSEFKGNNTTFQNLVKMQHYALPTRLLDITSNALIALYFACVGDHEKEKDGEVIIFSIDDSEVKYFDDASVSLLSNLSKQEYLFSMKRMVDAEEIKRFSVNPNESRLVNEQVSTYQSRSLIWAGKSSAAIVLLDAVNRDGCFIDSHVYAEELNKVFCVKPEMDNPRIIRQDGAFLLFGMNVEKKMPASIPSGYLYKGNKERIIVKASEKLKIINELESLGITASNVYPEIENVAGHIKNRYS